MLLLAIETSGPEGGVAVLEDSRVVVETVLGEGMSHGRDLVPAVGEALARSGVGWKELGLLAVGLGPGSFTGLRIGVVCAKTLAWLHGIPLVGVPTQETLASAVPAGAAPRIAPLVIAKRGFWYTASFAAGAAAEGRPPAADSPSSAGPWRRASPDRMVSHDEFPAAFPPPLLVFGSGAKERRAELAALGYEVGPAEWGRPSAAAGGRLAAERFAAGDRLDPLTAAPIYQTLSAAEEARAKNTGTPSGGRNQTNRPPDLP